MSLPSLSPALRARLLFWAVTAAVPLAAFLSFSVQPLAGKLLLPVQGGAAPTWLGTMLYFQAALLAGYGWAAWLLRRRILTQVLAVCGLALVAMFCSRLPAVALSPWTGLGGILLSLTLATLPAMVLLFSIGPLMHGWLRRRGREVPYFLYAFSNAGGLAAVLLYPFVFEPRIGLSHQMLFWQGLLCALAGLVGIAAFCVMRARDEEDAPVGEEETEVIPPARVAVWAGLSALTCAGMLGATHHLTAEIGSSPIAWVGPFGAFLLSLLVIFSGVWQPRYTLACLGWLAVSVSGFMLTKGVSNATVDGWPLFWLMSLTAAGSFFGNGLLYEARPARRFSFFYLVQAAGGVLGGLFVALAAPALFLRPSEFIFLSSILLALGLLRLMPRREVLPVVVTLLVVLAPILGLAWRQTRDEGSASLSVRRLRNIYGCMLLEFRPGAVILSNETTTHDSQMTGDAAARRHPTLYYSESSGVGRTIEELQRKFPSIKIGVVGLGAGTLAAYTRPEDTIDFWDIDPKAIRVARDFFTYVPDARGQVHLQQADGRKGLEASTTDYDVIVIDAFCGDAIPAHLLTREAFAVYFRRLERRQGILVIHASNRYSTLFPIVGATAYNMFRWSTFNVLTEIASTTADRDWDADGRGSQYLIVCRPGQSQEVARWLPEEEDNGRVKRTVTPYDPQPPGRAIIWSDDRHAALDALDLSRYIMGK
jgi:hypothetical protein